MAKTNPPIRLGTRGSKLALTQAQWVSERLCARGYVLELCVIRTSGDCSAETPVEQFTGKGVFVAELEQALLCGEIDLAVHSMKDLPGEMAVGLTIACIPPREDPRDVLVGHSASTLTALPAGARVGTSSLRRCVQLRQLRPDLECVDMRGNVDTRLRKLDEGQYDAICLAAAGLQRLGLAGRITEYFSPEVMVPAAGQGALALQTRDGDTELRTTLAPLHDDATARAVRAERTVLALLGGGCAVPFGVLATESTDGLTLMAALGDLSGEFIIREQLTGTGTPEELGREMARRLMVR